MTSTSVVLGKSFNLKQWQQFSLEILILTTFFCLSFLLEENMGEVNEVNLLPFARQHADPTWIPEDWYYNLPAGYRTPFITIFGNMAAIWGFLMTSIVGRFFVFTLLASSLVFLGRTLGLKLTSLLVAMTIFLFSSNDQGLIAEEWLIRALEPKAIAYSLILFGITFMLRENYRLMALFLGLAISFHVLVGGWAALTVLLWFLCCRRDIFSQFYRLTAIVIIYFIAASFAIPPIIRQLFSVTSDPAFSASYIYVHLRTPHHLNPLSWSLEQWIQPIIYFLFFALTIYLLWNRKNSVQFSLGMFALCAMIPFTLGILIAPWDAEGKILQYYPFRFGDVMFPLITCLLFIYSLQAKFLAAKLTEKGFLLSSLMIVTITVVIQGNDAYHSLVMLRQFPSEPRW
jgi:small basic protein